MTFRVRHILALILALFLLGAVEAGAVCLEADQLPAERLAPGVQASETRTDRGGRMVAPVMVNGQGPFRFIVDTGANRSVVSQTLATRLGLVIGEMGEVHSIEDVSMAPLARLDSLNFGDLSLPAEQIPVLDGPVLAGQQGLLGVDGMFGRRLKIDFERRCIEIGPAGAIGSMRTWTAVRGELKFGHLVVMPGRIRSYRVNILIDTGSDTSLANTALRDQLRRTMRVDLPHDAMVRAYTAGMPIALEYAIAIPELNLGEMEVHNIAAYVGDLHIFELWGLQNEPTLLLGMDVLSQTRSIAIDYESGTVYFRLRHTNTGSHITR